jgi:hypothetical protein
MVIYIINLIIKKIYRVILFKINGNSLISFKLTLNFYHKLISFLKTAILTTPTNI